MNISLTPEMDQWVAELVKSGAYKSSSEVIRDGIRTLQRQEEQRRAMVEDRNDNRKLTTRANRILTTPNC